ncbi:hypothetical protein V1477_001696 [Vespula maculifrons]|uniref:Uncharacterized protein n=1 Tax=Vespula maculifrons TaxID=7453 RepID=A0ABD2CYK8_VESMC
MVLTMTRSYVTKSPFKRLERERSNRGSRKQAPTSQLRDWHDRSDVRNYDGRRFIEYTKSCRICSREDRVRLKRKKKEQKNSSSLNVDETNKMVGHSWIRIKVLDQI